MDDKTKSKIYKKHIIYLSLSTRLAVITLQFISNILIFDHEPDVFRSPKEPFNATLFDRITNTFLGGFLRWDAQYFYHIAKYGYTFENTLAFFPLYPFITRYITIPILTLFPFLDWECIALIVFVILNIFFFTKAALALFEMSCIILNRKIAYRTTILFCINPATIFFVAPYSECVFSYFTFWAMLQCVRSYYKNNQSEAYGSFSNLLTISLPVALSIATRSNGLLNIGFLVYFWVLFYRKTIWPHNIGTCINLIKSLSTLFISIVICLIPFIFIQAYAYVSFCHDFEPDLPQHIINFARKNSYVLPGTYSKSNQTWCLNAIPLVYGYVQKHYWNVGFLEYYELKQVPNFLLAFPIVFLIISNSIKFIKQHKNLCLNLGIFEANFCSPSKDDDTVQVFDNKMFVFIVHALYLTVFCIFFVHVQVTTRMLCSASPVLYWFGAYIFDAVSSIEYDLLPSWKCFLFTNELNSKQKFVKYYFLSYFFIGTILFSNNYPWT